MLRLGVGCGFMMGMLNPCVFAPAALLLALAVACNTSERAEPDAAETPPGDFLAYFGAYTSEQSQGIYVSRFDSPTGALSEPELAAEIENPSFLTVHPNQQILYAVSELDQGSVSSFAIDHHSGRLTLINTRPAQGSLPCDLEVDSSASMLTVANYGSGSVISFPLAADGSLGEASDFIEFAGSGANPDRQQSPHAHSVDFSADNRFCLVSDLGTDQVRVYQVNTQTAKLTPHDPPAAKVDPGAGPRHFAFHPDLPYAYGLNELLSTVAVFDWDADAGVLNPVQTISTLPEGFEGSTSTAEIEVHPSGKFLYASNRGHDSIAVFAIDQADGRLTFVEHEPSNGGQPGGAGTPRSFAVAPGGEHLLAANQKGDTVVVFAVDSETGELAPTGTTIAVDAPVCIKFVPVS